MRLPRLRFVAALAAAAATFAAQPAHALLMMEAATVGNVTETWQTVSFQQIYPVAPVVFTLTGETDPYPSMVQIRNVTPTGFEIAQKEAPNFKNANAAASDGFTPAETVPFLAVLPGRHSIGDITFEVGTTSTTLFQAKSGSTGWKTINYGSFGIKPTLILQTQTMDNATQTGNQEDPMLPLLATAVNKGSVGASSAQIALERAEVVGTGSGSVQTTEVIGYLATTPNAAGWFLTSDGTGVLFETMTTADSIQGWGQINSPDGRLFSFASSFVQPPLVVGSDMSRDGGDGGWLRMRSLTSAQIGLDIDEDQFGDTERDHTSELAGLIAFSEPFVFTPEPSTLLLLALGLPGLLRRARRRLRR